MNSIETLREFLGWCTVLNSGMLLFAGIVLILMRSSLARIHAGLYGLDEADLHRAYFQYLAQYKIAIFVLNLVPYIALRIMA